MAGVSDRDLVTMAGWPAGIDNLSPETDLPRDERGRSVIAVREAENVDLTAGGKPRRRLGRTPVLAASRVHSLWRDGDLPFALFVRNGVLSGFQSGAAFDIVDGLAPGFAVSYALVGDRVFWSNGNDRGVVMIDGSSAPWGCPDPMGEPLLASTADVGGLDAGTYQVAITWQLATGEESGATLASVVDVPQNGGISLSSLPSPPAEVARVRVYVSPANGDVLYHAQDLTPGLPVAVIGAARRGKPLDTQFLERMPAGDIVRVYHGRLYVAVGSSLRWSEALRYGLTHPTKNRLGFGALSMVEPIGAGTDAGGIYVADSKRTYFLAGNDPAAMKQAIVNSCGVVRGSSLKVDAGLFPGLEANGEAIYWLGADGVACVGLPGGQVMRLRDTQVVAPNATGGASMVREQNGIRQVITALSETSPRGLQVQDRAVINVERYDQE